MTSTPPKSLAYFLLFLCLMVAVIAVVGALTRLTESGLSIMNWDFFSLFWQWPEAAKIDFYYQDYVENVPQYLVTGFSRGEFVTAVFWEWFHRNIGKTVGLIAIIGTVYFFVRRQVPQGFIGPVLAIAPLLAVQGFIGIFMVWSGYHTVEDVSHYRLALHLGTAFFAFGFYLWTALRILSPVAEGDVPAEPWAFALVFVCLTILFGAFTAGLNAWESSNTWPAFENGKFLPAAICADEISWHASCWINAKKGVHFIHRHIAVLTAVLILWAAFRTFMASDLNRDRVIAGMAAGVVVCQTLLGISLVIMGKPTSGLMTGFVPAVVHQLGALSLLGLCVTALYYRERV